MTTFHIKEKLLFIKHPLITKPFPGRYISIWKGLLAHTVNLRVIFWEEFNSLENIHPCMKLLENIVDFVFPTQRTKMSHEIVFMTITIKVLAYRNKKGRKDFLLIDMLLLLYLILYIVFDISMKNFTVVSGECIMTSNIT